MLNKCDLLTENIPEDDSTVKISAKKAQGIDRLLQVVAANLPETAKRMKLLLPYDKAGFTAKLRENGKVFTEEYTETGVLVDALVDPDADKADVAVRNRITFAGRTPRIF